MSIDQISPPLASEYLQWRNSPVTKFLVRALYEKREAIKEGVAEGHSSIEELKIMIGRTQGIKDSIDYIIHQFEYIEEEPDNSEKE